MARTGCGIFALLIAAGQLAACAPPQPPKLDVETQWSEAIANLGMFAIYPPSEDVMVGDAYLYLPNAQFFDLVRVTSAPLAPLARQFCYQETDRMAVDTVTGAKSGVVKMVADADKCAGAKQQQVAAFDSEVKPEHATRLREAAMPQLEVGRFSEAELAGAGLFGNFGAALGIGTSAQAAVRVKLTKLQTLTMEELRASRLVEDISVRRVQEFRRGGKDFPNSLTPLMLARSLRLADHRNGKDLSGQFCRGEFETLNRSGVRVVVANRVLYASGLTFEFMNNRVSTVRLALDFASVLAGMPQAPVVPPLTGAKPPNVGGADAPPKADQDTPATASPVTLHAKLAALLGKVEQIATLDASKAGQVSARLTTGQFGNLAMTETFVRPAAVGMGAALHFPIAEAAVPAGEAQIEEALAWCRATHGVESTAALQAQLRDNYEWALFLEARAGGRVAQITPAARMQVNRLPAMPIDASVRVRQ